MKKPIFFALIALLLASLACTVNIDVPRTQTTETQTVKVNEPVPEGAEPAQISINMGAGTLNIAGSGEALIQGTIKYNVKDWKPAISTEGRKVTLQQGNTKGISGFPSGDVVNTWTFQLTNALPLALEINAGAYQGELDLTGLRLKSLVINDGASKSSVVFKEANPVKMDKFAYKTGASQVKLEGLALANFSEMSFESGAGDYTLDFTGGKLAQETAVQIKTGVSNVTIRIPKAMNVKVHNLGAVSNVDTQGTWTVESSTYTASGEGPLLTINVGMGVGNLELVRVEE